jgi:hypothetical protein
MSKPFDSFLGRTRTRLDLRKRILELGTIQNVLFRGD